MDTVLQEKMLIRICAEYLEMPGMGLNREQARRLWHLDDKLCADLLDSLVEARFLRRRSDGSYVRACDGRPSPASVA